MKQGRQKCRTVVLVSVTVTAASVQISGYDSQWCCGWEIGERQSVAVEPQHCCSSQQWVVQGLAEPQEPALFVDLPIFYICEFVSLALELT